MTSEDQSLFSNKDLVARVIVSLLLLKKIQFWDKYAKFRGENTCRRRSPHCDYLPHVTLWGSSLPSPQRRRHLWMTP